MIFNKAIILAVAAAIKTATSACVFSSDGNWYCNPTTAITYEGVGYAGSYQEVTNMDETSGACSKSSYSFSGSLSPLDEELSVHFRGPIKLLQFGVYYPSSSNSKRDAGADEEDCSTTQHVHHYHKRAPAVKYVTETVIVDQFGNTQTVEMDSAPTVAAASAPAAEQDDTPAPAAQDTTSSTAAAQGTTSTKAATTSSEAVATTSTSSTAAATTSAVTVGGAWTRSSYFTPGSADNCVFLNTMGGAQSGVWSSTFGMSLSYCGADGASAVGSAVALGDVTVASNTEFSIFSGSECDSDCGYYREGIPAYKGFSGDSKIFVFEFEMPTGTGSSVNDDMPAVWLLNAKVPRTQQYGDCSCWGSGCGELDLFEVLSTGSNKMVSHLHDGQGNDGSSSGGGGTSDYFVRPTSGSFKAAAVFLDGKIHIVEVSDDFASSLSTDTVNSWISSTGSVASI